MRIVISGSPEFSNEVQRKFGATHEYTISDHHPLGKTDVAMAKLIIDDEPAEGVKFYSDYLQQGDAHILSNSLFTSLHQIVPAELIEKERIFGFCGWPTFIERKLLEVTAFDGQQEELMKVCENLDTEYKIVADRVGMATPRVIAMIINEAYYTVQEGTAEKPAIDQAMKLGTNYPYGPFEWADRIGLINIYNLLMAIYEDTGEERYKICPLLKKEIFTK